jgi:hypothetical protein
VTSDAVVLPGGGVLLTGGTGPGRAILASAERFEPGHATFESAGALAAVRHKHAAVPLLDGRVLITGGSDGRDWQGMYDSAELFDPATGRSQPAGRMSVARFKHRAVVLLDGRVLLAGGDASVEVFDPATQRFTAAWGGLDEARFYPAATLLPDGSVLITGGYGRGSLATTGAWLYRP